MSILTKVIVGLILLHLIIGFGWLMYKLSPQEGDRLMDSSESQTENEI